MNQTIFAKLRELLEPKLDETAAPGPLSDRDRSLLTVLYKVLSGDEHAQAGPYLSRLDRRVQSERGWLREVRAGLKLLSITSAKLFSGAAFEALSEPQRDQVLSRLLPRNRSQLADRAWRRKAKVTEWHLAQVFCLPSHRAFKHFVVQDILTDYFTSAAGWALVGYAEYPGRVRSEWEPCEVVAVHEKEGGGLLLELSDGTFDELLPEALVSDSETVLAAVTKSGRQRARFRRSAYSHLAQYLEETDAGELVLKVGDNTWSVERSHD